MSHNKRELNADKTEVLVMGTPKMRSKHYIHTITIDSLIVPVLNELVGNRCAAFEPNMNMCAHVLNAI